MAPREIDITIISAKDLKNVNWRHGQTKPYAVVWVDPNNRFSTRVDEEHDTCPFWDHTLTVPLNAPIDESTLFIDIVHAGAGEGTKPLIGSVRFPLRNDVVVDHANLKLDLRRPSGRPQGKIEFRVSIRESRGCPVSEPYYAGNTSRDCYAQAPMPYGNPYAAPPPAYPYGYGQPSYGQMGYSQPGYGQPVGYGTQDVYRQSGRYGTHEVYGQSGGYGSQEPYGQASYGGGGSSGGGSKFGMGTGLAVGAVAGVLGGIALVEGAEYVEDKITDDIAEKVEDDFYDGGGYDGGGYDGGGYDGDDF
ncbi:protein SRC2-like [Impatiens glandulifera]|uniref:protein SRC2-like n=1 Tax=Impatiens glandulifera TaxID=253017 RepID=UPI001FB07933|nr:protein SRC2-like [Impatiens glandulifera]